MSSHNTSAKSVAGVGHSQVTLTPAVPAQPNTETRTYEFLPTAMPFNTTCRVSIPMAQLVRKDHYETTKRMYLKCKIGLEDVASIRGADVNLTELSMSCRTICMS